MCEKDSFLTMPEFHKQYWKCRDFEINNLWQRSIFLGTFLVLSYTAYGAFFGKAFLEGDFDVNFAKWYFHLIACILALIGTAFSVLWIAMAKGSKAWFECYEKAIVAIEKEMASTPCEKLYSGFGYRYRKFFNGIELDDSIFSSKGGSYSPSKINIALGQLSFVIWIGVLAFHTAVVASFLLSCCRNSCFCCCQSAIFIVLFVLAVITFALLVTVSGSKKILGLFDISSKTIGGCKYEKENLYAKISYKLSILEKIYNNVKKECGNPFFDIIEVDEEEKEVQKDDEKDKKKNLYLVFPLDGNYAKSLKLDVCVKYDKISLCIKRIDNENFDKNDNVDEILKARVKGMIDGKCYRLKDDNGSDLFKIEEGIQRIIDVLKKFGID